MGGQVLRALSQFRTCNNAHLYIITLLLISALIVDAVIVSVSDFLQDEIVSPPGIILFILTGLLFIVAQYIILQYVKRKTKDIRSKSHYLDILHKVVTVVQYGLCSIFIFVILEMLFGSRYHLANLFAAEFLSYILYISVLILFAERLLRWYRSYRSTLVVLLYGISAIILALTSSVAIIEDSLNMATKEPVITPAQPIVFPSIEPGTFVFFLSDTYHYSDLISTVLVWSTTVLLLHHYFDRLPRQTKIKVWVLMTAPLIYFLGSFAGVFDLYSPETDTELFWFYIYTSLNSAAAGILFGLSFRIVAKSIRPQSAAREYMIMAAFGFALLFISSLSLLTPTPYPPFGLVGVSTMGLSAYLIFIGIYSSGISISEDLSLRRSIRKSATEEAQLLVSIGSAQMRQKLEKKVLQDASQEVEGMMKSTGIQPSLTENDMRAYLNAVIKEIRVLQGIEEIIKKGKQVLETSVDYSACMRTSGLRLAYNNYFETFQKIMDKYKTGNHDGIRVVTSIDKDNLELVRSFLKIGVQVRHVKNMPPIDFSVSDKDTVATILKPDYGELNQNLLVSNEAAYLSYFVSIFEQLWKGGIEAESRIVAIEEGVDSEGIEIVQNPSEILALRRNLLRSAQEEILMVFPAIEYIDPVADEATILALTKLLKEAAERGVKIRIVTSKGEPVQEAFQTLVLELEQSQRINLVEMRYIEPHLLAKISVVVVDMKYSLALELKDYTRHSPSMGIMGLATYSNSKATVTSYASMFETLWKQTEMYEQLKIHDRMQKEFINIAAHELRNPIQPLVLSSESLKGSMPDEERVSIVIRNAKKLQILANEILDVTKIESKALKLNKENIDLREIILYGIKDLQNYQTIAEGKVNLIYVPSKEDIFVEADRDRVGQVISNLLNNAIKFTEEGSISIIARKPADSQEVVVSVKDTGCGIDHEILPRLFSKFVTKSETGGTGLGLYICKSIIEAHGGKIWAENNKSEKGATFCFSLPCALPSIPLHSTAYPATVPPKASL
jgi:nitrogen-specific signal transduction histidine kinase